MKSYFVGASLTIPFNHVTCVQDKSTESQKSIYVHLMVNSPALYDKEAERFYKEYYNWLDRFGS